MFVIRSHRPFLIARSSSPVPHRPFLIVCSGLCGRPPPSGLDITPTPPPACVEVFVADLERNLCAIEGCRAQVVDQLAGIPGRRARLRPPWTEAGSSRHARQRRTDGHEDNAQVLP
jgi:hypothetical protein